MREIEIKLRTKDVRAVEEKLAAQGCALSSPISQHDVVYAPNEASAKLWEKPKEGDVILRIRRQSVDGGDAKAIFTLKQQRTNELDNTEIETEIADPDAFHRALLLMGCVPAVEVKKVRRKGRLKDYEICLDEVEKLGSFVELEKLADDDADPVAVEEELFKTLEPFGLSRADKESRGYDVQIYKLERGGS